MLWCHAARALEICRQQPLLTGAVCALAGAGRTTLQLTSMVPRFAKLIARTSALAEQILRILHSNGGESQNKVPELARADLLNWRHARTSLNTTNEPGLIIDRNA